MPDNEAATSGGKQLQPIRGVTAREEFGATELMQAAETAATAVAARSQAEIQARYIVAMRQPRDIETVRVRLLADCKRPGFAQVARYHKPIGRGVEGPSIRFAEAALRHMGNVYTDCSVVFEDAERRIVRVVVADAESNIAYASEIPIDKTVERKTLKPGDAALRVRKNSKGETVYLIPATEDDLLNKQNALISKSIRTSGLRLVPGDLLEDAMTQVLETLRTEAAKDPDAEKRRIFDAFASIGVMPDEIRLFLGHDVDRIAPAELVELRQVYSGIRDSETTWDAIMAARIQPGAPGAAAEVAAEKIAALKAEAPRPVEVEGEAPPDPLQMASAQDQIRWKGKLWRQNEQRTGWLAVPVAEAVEASPPAPKTPKPRFGGKG